jgi:iron complex transport system permease protein
MNYRIALSSSILFFLGALVVTPFLGMRFIEPELLFRSTDMAAREQTIFWTIRMPRVLLAAVAGMALAVSGMAFQGLFRNPLATPYTLGVASGASFGAGLYVFLGFAFSVLGIGGISLFAFAGAVLATVLVYGFSRWTGQFSIATLLLAGVAIAQTFSSLLLFIQYLSDFTGSYRIVHWLMGGLHVMGYSDVLNVLPFAVAGTVILGFYLTELNLMITGRELAGSRGVDTERVKVVIFFAVSLMIGGVVAVCGPIGFVGLMIPHICRQFVGADHRRLFPVTLLFGGGFLMACDAAARLVIAPVDIPVGVLTALIGGPFFLWLLLRQTGRSSWF